MMSSELGRVTTKYSKFRNGYPVVAADWGLVTIGETRNALMSISGAPNDLIEANLKILGQTQEEISSLFMNGGLITRGKSIPLSEITTLSNSELLIHALEQKKILTGHQGYYRGFRINLYELTGTNESQYIMREFSLVTRDANQFLAYGRPVVREGKLGIPSNTQSRYPRIFIHHEEDDLELSTTYLPRGYLLYDSRSPYESPLMKELTSRAFQLYREAGTDMLIEPSLIVQATLLDIAQEQGKGLQEEKPEDKTPEVIVLKEASEYPQKSGLLGELLKGDVLLSALTPGSNITGIETMTDLNLLNQVILASVTKDGVSAKELNIEGAVRTYLDRQNFFGRAINPEVTVIANAPDATPNNPKGRARLFGYLITSSLFSSGYGEVGKYLGAVSFNLQGTTKPSVSVQLRHLQGKGGIEELEMLLDDSRVRWEQSQRLALRTMVSAGLPSLGKRR